MKPRTYPHVIDWERLGRKGHRCEILRGHGSLVQVAFQDGTTGVIDRRALRLYKAPKEKLDREGGGGGTLPSSA